MCSIFQHPFYPYSGTDKPAANMCNVPLAAGCGGEEFRDAVTPGVDAAPQGIQAADDFHLCRF
jgi:acetoin utilization deacetylase AcuC-like enzyme